MSQQKIALVTGGSRGLGKNMALALAKKGVDVVLTYNSNNDEAQNVVSEIESLSRKAATLQLNVGESALFGSFFEELRSTLLEKFGTDKFDYLINNAGTGMYVPFAETTEEQLQNMFDIHLKAAFFMTQKALPHLNDNGGIVNVSSGLARFSFPGSAAYAAMKGGVEVMTRYLAKELGSRGIRANVVAPGPIETDFGGGRVRDSKELNEQLSGMTALGRVGLPDDIGSVVAFLCSDDAKWVNAQRIEVSGGLLI
ncbi:SDR family NAD(P)-dependent oxidoreductase [Flavobacterium selenitireducens]|uniref:SDR family NAD(P)-dependent oxidoreductase n=1 Tax=Flavobacterium selenitireducens TaxID=2722704 RepID=UPI00168A9979|nr:SDR family oxidoreductase [Flavobacterium selenitireducens]MBD3582873.1 SDR family oxidoreductase [Flavobacterium selenitireducens]